LSVLLALLLACGPKDSPSAPAEPDAVAPASPPAEEMLPTPYTAEQIRDAMPVGTTLKFVTEEAGKPAVTSLWTVVAADAETGTFRFQELAPDGTPAGVAEESTFPWADLRDHALFPAAGGRRVDSEHETPAGRFRTLYYEVTTQAEGQTTVSRYHFAVDHPGPPVWMQVEQSGEVALTMTLVARSAR
jgi:hypothetical protein